MSFSARTKNALARQVTEKECCQRSELAGLIRVNGTIRISSGNRLSLEVATENAAAARKVVKLSKELYGIETEILVERRRQLRKNNRYLVRLSGSESVRKMLNEAGIIGADLEIRPSIPEQVYESRCCRRSYLRGVFLGSGSISEPENAYHLEITTTSQEYALEIVELMREFELKAKISKRKNRYIVYLKESEQIVTFLNVIGAHSSLFELENIRIQKGLRNQVNRLVNCETANLNKTVNAALRQREAIKYLDSRIGLENLPNGLRTVAELRLNHPEINLKEMGELLEPPLGKSGVNHRLRKLESMAEKLREKNHK